MKILIVEDEPSLREVMRTYLERERYVVETVATYGEAVEKIALYDYDCILLDVMLPDGNGLDLLAELEAAGKRGNVIVISAKGAIEDKVRGLELGADDYLAKPFHLAELAARIRSLTRRKEFSGERFIVVGNVRIDPASFGVAIAGVAVELSRKEYDILHYFASRPAGRLVDKEALAEAVWGDAIDQADNFDFIYAQVKNLRKKMREARATVEIKAVYGLGYKLVTELQ
ncbi:MAG: response regulator transcription factor [Rikenellaceae bacterium]|jgi:DNA-binding response OmpR family regulator|nr:response regulator transcription factor [Rikenellaceae bacterium]